MNLASTKALFSGDRWSHWFEAHVLLRQRHNPKDEEKRSLQESGGSSEEKYGRWLVIVVMCCVVSSICSIDRTAMSVTILPMSQIYHWRDTIKVLQHWVLQQHNFICLVSP